MNPKTEVHFTESKYKDTVGSQESRCGRWWGPKNFLSQVPIFLCTPAFLLGLFQLSLSFRTYGRLIAATGNSQACVTAADRKMKTHGISVFWFQIPKTRSHWPVLGGCCFPLPHWNHVGCFEWVISHWDRENSKEHTLAINPYLKIV